MRLLETGFRFISFIVSERRPFRYDLDVIALYALRAAEAHMESHLKRQILAIPLRNCKSNFGVHRRLGHTFKEEMSGIIRILMFLIVECGRASCIQFDQIFISVRKSNGI